MTTTDPRPPVHTPGRAAPGGRRPPSRSFLLAAWGGHGNNGPMLTAARRLQRRGHEVRLLGEPELRREVLAAGFRLTPWRHAPAYGEAMAAVAESPGPEITALLDQVVFGRAADYAADVTDELAREPTDAVIAHDFLIGAALAAEAAALPCALLSPHVSLRPLPGVPPVASGLMPARTVAERAALEAAQASLAGVLNEWLATLNLARGSLGLRHVGHVLEQYDRVDRVLLAMSEAFDFPCRRLPANVRYVGPLLDPPGWSGPWRSPWAAAPPRAPRVLVSFSTTFQDQGDALQRVVTALGGLPVDAIVTTGPAMAGLSLLTPRNVTVVESAPHGAVMREVALVVTHGGHGTVARALAQGLPLLVMPMGRDQDDNAARVAHRGAGLSLPPTASEEEIAAALRRLLDEPAFAEAAQALGRRIAPDLTSPVLVEEMEALTAGIAAPVPAG